MLAIFSLQAQAAAKELLDQAQVTYNQRAARDRGLEGIELWKQALGVDSQNYEASWKLARAHYWLGNRSEEKDQEKIFEAGKNYAEKAVAINGKGVEGHYWLGVCAGRLAESIGKIKQLTMIGTIKREMETVLELDPNHAGAHHVLGVLYRKAPMRPISVGNKKKALQYEKRAVELDAGSIRYAAGLAEAYLALGDKKKAVEILETTVVMPPHPEYIPESVDDKEQALKLLAGLK